MAANPWPCMFEEAFAQRLRPLAAAFAQSDLVHLGVADGEFEVEFERRAPAVPPVSQPSDLYDGAPAEVTPARSENGAVPSTYDVISSDVVGIVHLARPFLAEGSLVEGDRELAYVEALGIRNAVRSRGPGRIAGIFVAEGDAVDYGRKLFAIDREQN